MPSLAKNDNNAALLYAPEHRNFPDTNFMKNAYTLLAALLSITSLLANPEEGFPWPPAWQSWQTRVGTVTGLATMDNSEFAVALDHGVAVLSADGEILRQKTLPLGETQGIACVGDFLVLASGGALVVVDRKTLALKANLQASGRIYQVASNADGSRVAVAGYGKEGVVVTMADQTPQKFPVSSCPRGVAWLPSGNGLAFATDTGIETFKLDGTPLQTLSFFGSGRGMNSAKLSVSSDGKWLIATDETGAMEFWPSDLSSKSPVAAYTAGGPWFAAFYAGSPNLPYVGRDVGEMPVAAISVLDWIPCRAAEVTGIVGRPDGTVVFSTWGGGVICWDLAKASATSEVANPLLAPGREHIPLPFGDGVAYFSPSVQRAEGQEGIANSLRFEQNGKALVEYPIPGVCSGSSSLTAKACSDGHAVVVSTGSPAVKVKITMKQLQETPALMALVRTDPGAMVEVQPSVYVVDGKSGEVTPVVETSGISAHYLDVNGDVAAFAGGTGSEWNGLMTMDVRSKKMLRTGTADVRTDSPPKVFAMAADKLAVTARDSKVVHWMTHKQKEIPKSEGSSFRTKLPFNPNGFWTTVAETTVGYDVWTAAASPDGKYLAAATETGIIDLLAWGEAKPIGCFADRGETNSIRNLYWRDNDTLVCENGAVSFTYRVSSDLLRPVAFVKLGGFLGMGSDGKPCVVDARPENPSLSAGGLNNIVARKDGRLVAWLPSISAGLWCELPDRNMAVFYKNGLWVADASTGNIVRGYKAPATDGVAATKDKFFTRCRTGGVLEWIPPQK